MDSMPIRCRRYAMVGVCPNGSMAQLDRGTTPEGRERRRSWVVAHYYAYMYDHIHWLKTVHVL